MSNNDNISRNKVVKSLFWVYLENISAQLVTFVVSIVLARLLLPSDYGLIALVTVFINIANVFVSASFNMSLVQKKDADRLDYNTLFWFNCVLSIVLYIILFFSAPYIARYYEKELLTPVIRVLSLSIPLSAYNSIQVAYVNSKMTFRKSFVATSAGAIISGIIGIIMAYKSAGLWALVAQRVINIFLNTIFLSAIVDWKPAIEFSWRRFQSLFRFGWKILVTGLMFTGYSELRSLVIGKRYSADDLAYYNRGFQFPQFIASNIDTTITRVMLPTFSKSQDNAEQLVLMTRRAAKTSAYIMTPILFGLAVVGENVVHILLTDKWLPCVPFLQIMCIVWWLQPTQSCSIQAINAIGRSDIYLRIEIISKVLGISLLVGAVILFNTPFAIAISMLIGQMSAVFIYGSFVQKYIGYKLIEQIKDIFIPGLIGAVMSLGVYGVGRLISNGYVALIIQIIVGGIIYLALSHFLKIEEYKYLKNLIIRRKS